MAHRPEREYEFLSEAVGGRYFNISLSSNHHMNPFDLPMPREDETAEDVLRSNHHQSGRAFPIDVGRTHSGGRFNGGPSHLGNLRHQGYHTTIRLFEYDPPLLSDFEMVLSGMDGSDSVVSRLAKIH